jgi:ATP-binding cassette subfamily C (CFTR/MRP) protein 1
MMFSWVAMLFGVLGTFIVISISTPWFLAVVVPLVVGYYLIQRFYIKTSRQLKRIESITRSPVYSHFGESVSGQSVIRAYKEEHRFKTESETKVDHNQSIAYQTIIADLWLGVRLEIVGAFIVLFACFFAILARDDIGEATVGLSISYALQISAVLSYFVMIATEVESNIVSVERVEEYADLPQEAAWKTVEITPEWPQQGVIEFRDFQVRYRDNLDLVLKGLSFKCNSSEKIGIVGRTGAGKSSMTLSLFRIIEAAGGKILIDGTDISEIGLHSLRSRLTIIPQDAVLFSGTLRMNIDPFGSHADDAIWTALEHSHLKAFVKSLPDGLAHNVSEGGENLSVGQRQLVCLARALLRKTKVLILDEATAAIDIETDELIQKTIRAQFGDCTILTIAHRLNTIMDSDRIIVLDGGEIAEFDTPSALLANRQSIFYEMARDAGLVSDELAMN